MSPSLDNNDQCRPEPSEQTPGIEQSFFAELIYRLSDMNVWHIWPLLAVALACAGSVLVWCIKEDWPRFLYPRDMDYVIRFLNLLGPTVIVLKVVLAFCVVVFVASLGVFVYLFFKRAGSRTFNDAVNILLTNSFYLGISLAFLTLAAVSWHSTARTVLGAAGHKMACAENLKKIGRALSAYEKEKYYPRLDPESWCDPLIEFTSLEEKDFICPGAKKGRCHYALNNPHAEPAPGYRAPPKSWASGKLVLAFEAKPGWNQSGGPELLATENHHGQGCNILFDDGSVLFIRTERLGALWWYIGRTPSTENEETTAPNR